MGKNQKSGGLGRTLVKQHNKMVQRNKDKGPSNLKKKVLESYTDISDIDAIIEQADHLELLISTTANGIISLDGIIDMTPEEKRKQRKREEALHASRLRVPCRPLGSADMSVEELDENEREAFLIWRRNLARLEENEKLVLTPFEKNLDIWRQLWRVVERSDLEREKRGTRENEGSPPHDLGDNGGVASSAVKANSSRSGSNRGRGREENMVLVLLQRRS